MIAQMILPMMDDAANFALHQGTGGFDTIDKVGNAAMIIGWGGGAAVHKWGYKLAAGQTAHEFEMQSLKAFGTAYNAERALFKGGAGFFSRAVSKIGGEGSIARSLGKGFGATSKMAMFGHAFSRLETVGNVLTMSTLAIELGRGIGHGLSYLGQDRSRPNFSVPFMDTEQAFTQRQAALQAIHNSQLQTRSMFMREAQAMHS